MQKYGRDVHTIPNSQPAITCPEVCACRYNRAYMSDKVIMNQVITAPQVGMIPEPRQKENQPPTRPPNPVKCALIFQTRLIKATRPIATVPPTATKPICVGVWRITISRYAQHPNPTAEYIYGIVRSDESSICILLTFPALTINHMAEIGMTQVNRNVPMITNTVHIIGIAAIR